MPENVPDHLRCRAQTQANTRCRRQAALGDGFCEKHRKYQPVEVPALPARKAPEKVQSELVAIMASVGVELVDESHLEPVNVMHYCVTQTKYITDQLTTLLRGQDFSERDSWPLIRQALDALEALRKSAEAAESAGMQRRRAAVEESKIQSTFLALDRSIIRFGFSPVEEKRYRTILGEEFHALGTAS